MNQIVHSHQTFSSKATKDILEPRCNFQTQREVKGFSEAELSVISGLALLSPEMENRAQRVQS